MNPVSGAFAPILGRPTWLVQCAYGSFVTMEFGAPALQIAEPRLMRVGIGGAPALAMRRSVSVRGLWHLWIYCCEWSLTLDGSQLAHDESRRIAMDRALRLLNGQALTRVQVDPSDGSTLFEFDLGCTLATNPAPSGTYGDEPITQWKLYDLGPGGKVLEVRDDGLYCVSGLAATSEDEHWLPIPTTC